MYACVHRIVSVFYIFSVSVLCSILKCASMSFESQLQQVMGPVTGVRVGEARCSFRGSVEKTALEEAGTCLHAN